VNAYEHQRAFNRVRALVENATPTGLAGCIKLFIASFDRAGNQERHGACMTASLESDEQNTTDQGLTLQ